MKLFKCHTQKMANDRIIFVQDKFNDIGPDVFNGFAVSYIVLANTTKTIRNYAFAGTGKCCIYLPISIDEIEPYAFDNIDPATTFYCVRGSYAEKTCIEYGLNVNTDVSEMFRMVDEQKREDEAQARIEEERRLKEERERLEAERRIAEEKAKIAEERRLAEERERLESERRLAEERERLEAERRLAAERALLEEERRLAEERERLAEERRIAEERERLEMERRLTEEEVEQPIAAPQEDKEEFEVVIDETINDEPPATVAVEIVKGCLDCGTVGSPGDKYCNRCGKVLSNVKRCVFCNEINELSDKFCAGCGTKI